MVTQWLDEAERREQVAQLRDMADALLTRLDPEGRMTALYDAEPLRAS